MSKKNVLIFPCGSEIGLELYKALKDSIHFNLIGGSSVDDHGIYVFKNYIGNLPMVDDPDFVTKVNEIVETQQVDYIFPAHDSVVLSLARAQAAGELKCKVITSPVETCEIARSKKKSYEELHDIIATPQVHDPTQLNETDLPVFLKPDVGQGSKGTHRANTLEEVQFYIKHDPTLLALEYLPGREYTVDCFTSTDGTLLFSEGRERMRVMNGISVHTETVNDPRFASIAQALNEKLTFVGVWFFQVKEAVDGELKLMEIAPRVAGTMGLVRCKGVNLPLMSLFQADGIAVSVLENQYTMTMDRALTNSYRHNISYGHVYLDFDDLLVGNEQVNTAVVAFIFQCINKGIKLHLLTKHTADLNQTLAKHRLENLFDEIIWIRDNTEKHTYIQEKDAIFIDDSFSERQRVHETHGIPTFDSHMLEGLMEVA